MLEIKNWNDLSDEDKDYWRGTRHYHKILKALERGTTVMQQDLREYNSTFGLARVKPEGTLMLYRDDRVDLTVLPDD